MDISRFFIDRPRFAGVLSIFIFLIGLLAIVQLPVSEYTEVAPPQVVVRAQFPGANPRVISETVATLLSFGSTSMKAFAYLALCAILFPVKARFCSRSSFSTRRSWGAAFMGCAASLLSVWSARQRTRSVSG